MESPADTPGRVTALDDLPTGPIARLAAGGYLLAALTQGHDLYCWGGHPGQAPLITGLSGEPMPVVVKDSDILDVGIGESHMVLLTHKREVFIVGNGGSGQLGLGHVRESVNEWAEITLPLDEDQVVTGVAAGPRNTFILVRKQAPDDER
jgi:regulator of chromosome condensation